MIMILMILIIMNNEIINDNININEMIMWKY